jgi:GT2 family glycosyltransferase
VSILKARILVLDNGSPQEDYVKNLDIFEMVKSTRLSIEHGATKRSQENMGFPRGANELFRMGSAPLIMLITDDVMVNPDAINVLVRRMDDPTIGICGMKLLFPPTSTDPNRPAGRVQHIGHGVNIRGEITHPLMGWSADNPKCNVSREVFSVTGAAFMVRRNLFRQVKGFSEDYGKGTFEDVELCLRIRQLGYKIFIDTNAVGYHHVGATVQLKKEGFPLLFNSMLFNSRWANSLAWTEWEMY